MDTMGPTGGDASRSHGPGLLFVGPMVGRHRGRVTTQPERMSRLFEGAGYAVLRCSDKNDRWARLCDTAATVSRRGRDFGIQSLSVFGGRSFVIEDVASRLGSRAGQRLVMVLHGGAIPEFARRFPRWFRRVLRRADAIVAPSHYLARAVAEHGFSARVIPNVIELASYPYRARRTLSPRLLWMRTFHRFWNPHMALRVLERLRGRWPEACLVMAGEDQGMQREVEGAAGGGGLAGAVRFPGFLDMEGKAREGEAADVFLNTNRIDNMPVAVVEACAMGIPVVSTNVGGIPDLLTDGETGLLVPDDDDRAMAEAVERCLTEPDLAERLSRNGRAVAMACDWEAVRPQWEEVFAAVMAKPGRGRGRARGGTSQARQALPPGALPRRGLPSTADPDGERAGP